MRQSFFIVFAIVIAVTDQASVAQAQFGFFTDATKNATLIEIDQLQSAMFAYKEMYSSFPPCCADLTPALRRIRIMRHLATAFTNSNYGATEDAYLALRDAIRKPDGLGAGSQAYNYKNKKGEIVPLDLDTLDQAEAIVFWLGGFPTPFKPDGTPVAEIRHFGFSRDRDSPFKRDSADKEGAEPRRIRTERLYDFLPERLSDHDDDGWPEYATQGKDMAPLVYFDSATYNGALEDPKQLGSLSYPVEPKLAEKWGAVLPILESFNQDDPKQSKFMNRTRCQLIAPGYDRRYGAKPAEKTIRLIEYSTGRTFTSTDGATFAIGELAKEEKDNLTSLGAKTLGDVPKQAKK